jgi:hypothetical protein
VWSPPKANVLRQIGVLQFSNFGVLMVYGLRTYPKAYSRKFTSQTPKSLNRSKPNLAQQYYKLAKRTLYLGYLGYYSQSMKFWEFSKYFEKFSFFWCSDMGMWAVK